MRVFHTVPVQRGCAAMPAPLPPPDRLAAAPVHYTVLCWRGNMSGRAVCTRRVHCWALRVTALPLAGTASAAAHLTVSAPPPALVVLCPRWHQLTPAAASQPAPAWIHFNGATLMQALTNRPAGSRRPPGCALVAAAAAAAASLQHHRRQVPRCRRAVLATLQQAAQVGHLYPGAERGTAAGSTGGGG